MSVVVVWPRHRRHVCQQSREDAHLHCPFCEGGLFLCDVCGGAEASLPTDCPGRRLTPRENDEIVAGRLDYRRDRGWHLLRVAGRTNK